MWYPILDGALRQAAREAADAVEHSVSRSCENRRRRGARAVPTACGAAQLALMYGYAQSRGANLLARLHLDQAADLLAVEDTVPSVHTGLAGVAWTVAHLSGPDRGVRSAYDCAEIDVALNEALENPSFYRHYDLMDGVVGIGLYFLERLPGADAARGIERVVSCLERTCVRDTTGIAWLTHPDTLPPSSRATYPMGFYALGVAHGMAGVVSLLARIWASDIARHRVDVMLEGAMDWLLDKWDGREFPSAVVPDRAEAPGHFFSWCWGSLGIAGALLSASRVRKEASWETTAVEAAVQLADRREDIEVRSACLCHGAVGHAHIFNRMFQATGNEDLRLAARYWYERAIGLRRHRIGIAGFRIPRNSRLALNLLHGASGIALGLRAAVCDTEPLWDRLLMLPVPSRTPADAGGAAEHRTPRSGLPALGEKQ